MSKNTSDAQHATRREWWLAQSMDRVMPRAYFSSEKTARYIEQDTPCEFIHVREVLPGEITINREDLRNAFMKTGYFYSDSCGTPKAEFSSDEIIEFLFGPLSPEGQEVGK